MLTQRSASQHTARTDALEGSRKAAEHSGLRYLQSKLDKKQRKEERRGLRAKAEKKRLRKEAKASRKVAALADEGLGAKVPLPALLFCLSYSAESCWN